MSKPTSEQIQELREVLSAEPKDDSLAAEFMNGNLSLSKTGKELFVKLCNLAPAMLDEIERLRKVEAAAEQHLHELQVSALDAGAKAGEAFARSKFSTSDYWLCIEFKLQQRHDKFAALLGSDSKCAWSDYRKFISDARLDWRDKRAALETK